jgi:hypothetical protein
MSVFAASKIYQPVCRGEVPVFSVLGRAGVWRSGCVIPGNCVVGTKWRCEVSFKPRLLYSQSICWCKKRGKVHPCTGTEGLYRPHGP